MTQTRTGRWRALIAMWVGLLAVVLILAVPITSTASTAGLIDVGADNSDWPMSGHDPAGTMWNKAATQIRPPLKILWTKSIANYWADGISVANGMIYLSGMGGDGNGSTFDPNRVVALTTDGQTQWSYTLFDGGVAAMSAPPAFYSGVIFFGGQHDDRLYAVDGRSGTTVWTQPGMGEMYASPPVVYNGTVFAFGLHSVRAVSANTGNVLWSSSAEGWAGNLAVWNNTVVALSWHTPPIAFDAATGRKLWQRNDLNTYFSNVIAQENTVYFGARGGRIYALDLLDGHTKWSAPLPNSLAFTTVEDYSVALANGILYAAGGVRATDSSPTPQNILFALDARTGAKLWETEVAALWHDPLVANGVVYVQKRQQLSDSSAKIVALDASTGRNLWQLQSQSRWFHGRAIANERLYVIDNDGAGTSIVTAYDAQYPVSPDPIILVHGWGGYPGPETWGQMKDLLEQTLRAPVEYFDTWNGSPISSGAAQDKAIPIEVLAGRLGTQVRNVLTQFAPGTKVDIVAHSLGGLVARAWIAGMAVLTDANGTPIASGPPYNGEIRKLITAATPHYGAGGQAWCDLERLIGLDPIDCFKIQAVQMTNASQFLWDLHQRWESSPRPLSSDILTIVAKDDGVVTDPASATLSQQTDPDSQARYVNKDHISVDWNPWLGIGCGGTDGVVCVDGNHPTFKLVRSFLQNNSDPADCDSEECQSNPPSSKGSIFLQFVEKSNPSKPVPVNPLAAQRVVTYDLLSISGLEFYGGGGAGTLFVTDFPAGTYQFTVHGLAFNLLTPKYMDEFPLIKIVPGRTTVLQQALEKTADIYTVTLAIAKDIWVAGKDVFKLGVQLCCTIPTAQSNSYQSLTSAVLSQSTLMDGYVWVDVPGGGWFFLMPDFTNFTDVRMPVVTSLPVQDFAGTILSMPIPADLSTGTYTFFAVGVVPGTDPFNSANWVTNRAELSVTLTQ